MIIAQGALLLERIHPGRTYVTIPDDEEATRIAARLMRDSGNQSHKAVIFQPWQTGVRVSTLQDKLQE